MKQQVTEIPSEQADKRPGARRSPVKARTGAASDGGGLSLSIDERRALIAEAAYFRAESRGFAPDGETDDWLQAEAEVDDRLLRG